jgi:hypothetical protein
MADWPEQPRPGQSVRLPLPLPPMLLEAIGYHGGGRYVALRWWGGSGGDVLISDGSVSATGWWPAWRLLVREHPLGRTVFDRYDFGDLAEDPAAEARHWLLCDRWENTLYVGLARDVDQLLRTQPSELHAAARELGHARVIAQLLERWQPPGTEEVEIGLAREQALTAEVGRWLDRLQAQIEGRGER